jgi:predicted GIY-YIG superfamily endonuclease
MSFWTYMLRCSDDSFYVGHTDNLEKRLGEHQLGVTPSFTSTRRPVTLVWSQDFATREDALAAELQIKRWSRKKKEALIRQDWTALKQAARKDFSKNRSARPE